MSIKQKYEVAFQLRTLNNINIRQSCFLQVRCGVGQEKKNKENIFAQGYQIIQNKVIEEDNKLEQGEILSDGSYLSPKLFIRHNTKEIQINSTCIFKGQMELSNSQYDTQQIFLSCQLNWLQTDDVEVVSEWQAYLKIHIVNSAVQIFFPSHLFTCSIDATVHSFITSLVFQNEQELIESKPRLYYNPYQKKMTHLYEAAMDPIVTSKKSLEEVIGKLKNVQSKDKLYWKYKSLQKFFNLPKSTKYITIQQKEKLSKEIRKLKNHDYIHHLREDSHELTLIIYPLWKELISLIQKQNKHNYFEKLKTEFHACWNKERWLNKIQIYNENHSIQQLHEQPGQLLVKNFEKSECKIRLSLSDYEAFQSLEFPSKKAKVLVLVHGFQASSYDMEIIAMYFKLRNPDYYIFISQNNEGRTEGAIEDLGHRLAVEVKNYLNSKALKDMEISFIGHSLGGLIIRSSLKYLQLYKKNFKSFITLCSPHLSYLHHTSTLVTTSLWVMNKLKKDQSMIELTMQDHQQLNKTFMYDLSNRKQLIWFENILLFGSKEDEYVPYQSALALSKEFFLKTQESKVYRQLQENLTKNIEDKIIRIQLVYNDKIKDLSTLIGRTAHIKPLSYLPVIDIFTFLCSKKI